MIVEIFQDIVSSLTTDKFTFAYGDKQWQNLKSDKMLGATIWLNDNFEFSLDLNKMSPSKEMVFKITLFISYKSKLDWTPEQRYPYFKQCALAQNEILEKLIKNPIVQTVNQGGVTNIKGIFLNNIYDANRDGILLTFNLKLKDISNRCYA